MCKNALIGDIWTFTTAWGMRMFKISHVGLMGYNTHTLYDNDQTHIGGEFWSFSSRNLHIKSGQLQPASDLEKILYG